MSSDLLRPTSRDFTEFPANSLLFERTCGFWAEFKDFFAFCPKIPAFFPDISFRTVWRSGLAAAKAS
jgi:hypothetical protein